MQRKLSLFAWVLLGGALLFFGLYGLWAGWQQAVEISLRSGGAVTVMIAGRHLLLPEMRLVVGTLALGFWLLTLVLLVLTAWLFLSKES